MAAIDRQKKTFGKMVADVVFGDVSLMLECRELSNSLLDRLLVDGRNSFEHRGQHMHARGDFVHVTLKRCEGRLTKQPCNREHLIP